LNVTAEFVTSAADIGDFPGDQLAEVALVGRSNVGKSSLINALVRRPLARTSAAPGKTRLANFFRVQRGSAPPFYLVDLPGYGYARGGGRDTGFERLTAAYFGRPGARAALLLVDSRHPALNADIEAWGWLQAQPCTSAVVGTKVDKLTRVERTRHSHTLTTLFHAPVPMVSALTGEGLDKLWTLIAKLPKPTAAPELQPPPRRPPRPRRPRRALPPRPPRPPR
jgi:GTP-binding protein